MKGRPPLPVGAHGSISYEHRGPSNYVARAHYRRADGRTVRVSRSGQSKGAARNRLLAALTEEEDVIGARMKVSVLVEQWLDEIGESTRRPQTVNAYRTPAKHIVDRIGDLRAAELTAGRCNALLRSVKAEQGQGAARNVRKVLNGICKLAVRHGALPANPVRDTESIGATRTRSRALSVEQTEELTDRLRSDPLAVSLDLPDLVEAGLATGCRIGELLAIRYASNEDGMPVLDLDAGTVEINATVVRVVGVGLIVQPRPKTAAGWRVLALPPYAIDMFRRRRETLQFRAPGGIVFGHPFKSKLRDPARVAEDLRKVLPGIGFGWMTTKTWRRTVATRLDEAGLSAREIADQIGHERPSLVQDVYMGRKVVSARAAAALER